MKLHLRSLIPCALALAPLIAPGALARGTEQTASGPPQVFVFVQRASSHVKYSKSEVFHKVLDDLIGYLKKKNVAMAADEFGGRSHSEDEMPLSTVQGIARDADAEYLLYALVERPFAKWIKVTVTCYDRGGQRLWQEEASNASAISGSHALRVTLERLHEKLDKRLAQPGLPVMARVEGDQQTGSTKQQ